MGYNISVRNFLAGSPDLGDFYARFFQELERVNRKYNLLVKVSRNPGNRKGKLKGLPVSAKDCICVKGLQSAAGSKILEGYTPPFSATCIERAQKEGGNIIGKTQQDEFGFGTFSANSGFGVPKNPLDPTRSCGGSSGGAAGLVAALDFPHIALAESTGGSISCPASFCGVVGLTPTYGLVSRYGLIDYANSLDKIGVMGRSVWDTALMLSVIAGHDERDSTSLKQKPMDYTRGLDQGIRGIKIGIPREYLQGIDPGVEKAFRDGIERLESLGARCQEMSLPNTRYALSSYYMIATAEASTNLAKFCGMRYGASLPLKGNFNEYFSRVRSKYFGQEAKRRVLLGTYARMAGYRDQYYLKAMRVRTLIIREFKKAFGKFDTLAAPTMPCTAPRFSEIEKMNPIQQYMMDVLTVAPNLAGIPQLSVPFGKSRGMPVGLHLLGDHLQEGKILRAGTALEAGE